MRWWQWVLVVLLVAGAVRALVDLEVPDDAQPTGLLPGDPEPAGAGPGLSGRGAARNAAPVGMSTPRPAGSLPASIARDMELLGEHKVAQRVWRWVQADPRRLLDLIAHELGQLEPRPEAGHPYPAARHGEHLVQAWRKARIDVDLHAALAALLAESGLDESTVMGLLGMLERLPPGDPAPYDLLRAIAFDRSRGPCARLRAARMLVIPSGLPVGLAFEPAPTLSRDDLQSVRELLTDTAEVEACARGFGTFVGGLSRRRDILPVLAPALVAAAGRPGMQRWARAQLLGTILSGVELDPEARAKLVGDWEAIRPPRKGEPGILRGDIDKALAWMETASAAQKIHGVKILLGRGVKPERLHRFVLASLASASGTATQAAVNAIALVQVPDADVLATVEPMLRRPSRDSQTRGVQALGMLARNPGDHDAAIDRLFAICRDAEHPKVRVVAVQSILMHEARPRPVIGLLGQLLGDAETEVRREAADALGELAGEHADARHALEGARNDSDDGVRELIAYWLDATENDDD